MTSAIGSRSESRSLLLALTAALSLALGACASFVEVPVETPLQSKLDVSAFRRVLIAGFVSDPGEADVDLSPETVRPLQDALDRLRTRFGDGERLSKADRESFRLEAEKVLQDGEFWRRIGEEFQNPLIVTGKVGFETQNRSGFQTEERVVRGPDNRPRVIRGNRYLERKGFSLNADFVFVDGRTGQTLHKEKFTEEVLYGEDQKVSPLSSYFELMDRLLPNFLGVISPQKIRGTRVLLL
jgi:hypothetical protein